MPDYDDDEDLGPAEVETYFPDVYAWVEHWLLPHWKRDPSTARWDPRWWEYTEVLSRFEALWRAWEFLRLEGATGMAVFFRDYLDTAMPIITAADGPFWRVERVQATRHLPDRWASEPPPATGE
jgi:hypothetical protein